jgi:uncharacterized repeat protein (TIGR03803 family)
MNCSHHLTNFIRCCPIVLAASLAHAAPTLTKLHDFNNSGVMLGIQGAYDTPVLIGSELWFTTEKGGDYGFGTLASFNLANNTPTKRVSMNQTGNTPQGTPALDDGILYYTNTRGGTGDRGTLSIYQIASGTHSTLWNSPSNSPATNPNTPSGNVAVIDRGPLGKDIYMLTQNGGSGAAIGTILRYQSIDGSISQVHAFGPAPDSRQPFKGFTVVGKKLYFTTFTGGNISPSGSPSGTATNGTGTLNELDVTTRGAEIYHQLAVLPVVDGSTRFPAHNPYYRAADHSLYFTTVGTASQPGSIQKFQLATKTLSTLHEITALPAGGINYPEGRFIYGPLTEWNRSLYYATAQGGPTGNGGTINRYHLDSKSHEVLFHLNSDAGSNPGGGVRGGFLHNGSSSFPAFYLLTRDGGMHDHGTVLRLNLDPPLPPTPYEAWLASHPSLTGADSIPSADPDRDGLNNLTEFAFGTPPTHATAPNPSTLSQDSQTFEIRWTARSDSSITYNVTTSLTLDAGATPWEPLLSAVEILSPPDVPVSAGYERRRVHIPINEQKAFFRVEASFAIGTTP